MLGLFGTVLGIVANALILYINVLPDLKKRLPYVFGLDYDHYKTIMSQLVREQAMKTEYDGWRSVPGMYKDIDYVLDIPKYKVNYGCFRRKLNLVEFYHILIESSLFRKDKKFIVSEDLKNDYRETARTIGGVHTSEKDIEMIIGYCWEVAPREEDVLAGIDLRGE